MEKERRSRKDNSTIFLRFFKIKMFDFVDVIVVLFVGMMLALPSLNVPVFFDDVDVCVYGCYWSCEDVQNVLIPVRRDRLYCAIVRRNFVFP